MLQGCAKQDEVTKLMNQLDDDLKNDSLDPQQRDDTLAQLKAYGRDPGNAGAIFSKSGLSTLGAYSFGSYPSKTCMEASRCIANALLLVPTLRQEYVNLALAEKAAEKLKTQDDEDEFLMSRTLFLLTYETKIDLKQLSTTHSLAESINAHLIRHGARLLNESTQESPIGTMALIETLKLLFNLSNALPGHQPFFNPTVASIFKILQRAAIPKPPLQPPISSAINALANLDLIRPEAEASGSDTLFPSPKENVNIDCLIAILNQSIIAYTPLELESPKSSAIPLLTVLRKIYDVAPDQSKQHMQKRLLPSQDNRDLPIGHSDDLPSRLLRLTTSSGLLNLSECISALMYELSNKDANLYVRNVGYGFAAGYLVSHNIPVPESAKSSLGNGRGGESGVPVNPITGQRLDKEVQAEGPEMTREEKEREAERLFVLFERLKATGVVDVKDPLRQAMEQGKFDQRIEELSDSD